MRELPVRIGSYEIIIELAAGGMATTYIAQKRGEAFFERLVVVKRIHPWLLDEPNAGNMLREEARLGAALHHPHIVHVEDVTVDGQEVCLVMPYVESLSLGALFKAMQREKEKLDPALASRIMLDVLAGLDAAHAAKDIRGNPLEIVHRDVSPNNILVGTDGRSRIIDFGIARAKSRLCQTQSGDMKGTIAYMSPEQLRRKELDRRADIFAAGAVLYEALAGKKLFDGRDEADILIGVLADEVPSLCEHWPSEGATIDPILARALARDRDERFPSARVFAEALEIANPPASATEVAALVHRFGDSEFTRRRDAIRAFVDRQGNGEVSSTIPTATNTDTKSSSSTLLVSAKRRRLYVISGLTCAAVGGALFIAKPWIRVPDESPHGPLEPFVSTTVQTSLARPAMKAPELAPSAQSSAVAEANSMPGPSTSVLPKSPSTSGRNLPPIREKVEKRRTTELQENPY